ncbi:MAG: division/cell wall cluster transcriptional repressor MraZ [Bacteroidota bacterium]|nr:division/cell wall cluster transcriptional repressor MraZ [Bacteroidota bacterium]
MFVGEHIVKLDARGRGLFPAVLKRQMKGSEDKGFVLKRDIFEKCLVLYPMAEWDRENSILQKRLNPYNKEHAVFMRQFYRGTAELFLDANNRLLLPKRLITEIDAEKDLVFAGLDRKIEIWSLDSWNNMRQLDDFGSLAEKLLGQSENLFDDNEIS